MKAKLTYSKLMKIRKDLSKLAVPIGTVHVISFPTDEELAQWNRLPIWMFEHERRCDDKGKYLDTPCCPRCDRPMTRQPRGGLKCGRHDCTIRPELSTANLP